MIILKTYQEEAIEDLLKKSNKLIDLGGERLAVFQSPTGSGKTIMLAEFIKRLVTQNKDEKSISVIWAAPRKLHNQSKRKLEEYYEEKKQPKLGSIEHAEWQSKMNDVNGLADIILGKQRHGPTGTVKVEFEGIYTKFKDLGKN